MSTETNNEKDPVENIKEEAKSTVNDIKEGWNEATQGGENKKWLPAF
jgi:hypothetical protein